jgi:hypothetical protein
MNVSDESEIKSDDTLIVDEPSDQTVERQTERVVTVEVPVASQGPVPTPEPDKLEALTVESTMSNELTTETPFRPYPLPVPDPFDQLSALTRESHIVRLPISEYPPPSPKPEPIPEPYDELIPLMCEPESKTTPIDELDPEPSASPAPIPDPYEELVATIVEFQIAR